MCRIRTFLLYSVKENLDGRLVSRQEKQQYYEKNMGTNWSCITHD